MSYQSINPNDGTLLRSFPGIDDDTLDRAITNADACWQRWKTTGYGERAAVLNRAADLLRAQVDALATLATREMGKRINEARGEVLFSADILAYYATHAEAFLAPTPLQPKVGEAHMEYGPLGVLFCVEPWNFPYYQLARVAGPQLMAGNVLMVKHAGCVPQCALAFEKILRDAGGKVPTPISSFPTNSRTASSTIRACAAWP
jgi:succinate-semialdehyde dehydrogenase / glutarate-semialdehyde dehydrogenase